MLFRSPSAGPQSPRLHRACVSLRVPSGLLPGGGGGLGRGMSWMFAGRRGLQGLNYSAGANSCCHKVAQTKGLDNRSVLSPSLEPGCPGAKGQSAGWLPLRLWVRTLPAVSCTGGCGPGTPRHQRSPAFWWFSPSPQLADPVCSSRGALPCAFH